MVHILLIHQAFASLDEAGGTRHAELANFLAEAGHRVTIIACPVNYLTGQSARPKMKWSESQELRPGVTVVRTYTYAALHRSFFHRVLAFFSFMVSSFVVGLSIRSVDLVWGTSPPIFQGVTAWLLARLKGAPFLFEVRDLWPAFAVAAGVLRSPLLIKASLWLEKTLYWHADRLVVNSPGFIDHVWQRGARWVELIPNGADAGMFNPEDKGLDFRDRHNLGNAFVALYAGAHGMSNDLDVLLESARLLKDQAEIKLVLVGDGKEKKNLQAKAAQMQLTNLIFLPSIPKKEMAQALAAADACIAILKPLEMYKTTYPNKVFDYMAAGRPVLLLIDGVIRQVVEAGRAGVFIPPGDAQGLAQAICHLRANPKEGCQMGQNGRAYVEQHFDRAVIAGKLLLLVEEMRRVHD
jgi:glycosyltransferase involved in cell wall biosynthesis